MNDVNDSRSKQSSTATCIEVKGQVDKDIPDNWKKSTANETVPEIIIIPGKKLSAKGLRPSRKHYILIE
jgi:vacuolar-type H+-ATPase subunit F/Vma7